MVATKTKKRKTKPSSRKTVSSNGRQPAKRKRAAATRQTRKRSPRKPRYEPVLELPPLSPEEYQGLRMSIAVNGVLTPILVDSDGPVRRIIDGNHRKQFADELAYDCPEIVKSDLTEEELRTLARALNIARRHLTRNQKRQLVADQLIETPNFSSRRIGKGLGIPHTTVVAVRKELERTGTIPILEKTEGLDGRRRTTRIANTHEFYRTPAHAVEALLDREEFQRVVWEVASGDGSIVKVLKEYGYRVKSTDLTTGTDFLKARASAANIITNPPYSLAEDFLIHAKKLAKRKVAMLLPIYFFRGRDRFDIFKGDGFPLKKICMFSQRLTFNLKFEGQLVGEAGCHGWFVWERGYRRQATIDWIPNSK